MSLSALIFKPLEASISSEGIMDTISTSAFALLKRSTGVIASTSSLPSAINTATFAIASSLQAEYALYKYLDSDNYQDDAADNRGSPRYLLTDLPAEDQPY